MNFKLIKNPVIILILIVLVNNIDSFSISNEAKLEAKKGNKAFLN